MPTAAEKSATFRDLHSSGAPFIIPNPWDAGSARVLEALGFAALATTSSGFALTLGRRDHGVTRAEAIAHARLVASAVDIPVSADLEDGFGPAPEDVNLTIREACRTGLAGASIEDWTRDPGHPIFEKSRAIERVAAAVEAARQAGSGFFLTARAEGFLWGHGDLEEIISRLQAFEGAGADALFAPGLPDLDAVKAVCASISKPLNVLTMGKLGECSLEDLAEAGATRISVGGALAWAAYGSLVETAGAILPAGRFDALKAHADGARAVRKALT